MKKKLLILSMDAMIFEDLAYASTFPAFKDLMERGALIKRVRSVYPSLTYPCHVAMISGCYPDRSGVINNYAQVPGADPEVWNFFHDTVKVDDLMDAAHRAGYSTASVSWPVSGNHKSIDYLVDEIWAYTDDPEDFKKAYLTSGTDLKLFEELVEKWVPLRMKRNQPGTGRFSTHVAAGILRKYAPDVMAVHLAPIDTFRHEAGVFSEKAREGVAYTAEMLQEILDALKATGNYDRTDIIITSDHGQIDTDRAVCPNTLLKDAGYITLNPDGSVHSYQAWAFSAGASAQVLVTDPTVKEDIYALFRSRLGTDCGYRAIFRKEELAGEHYDGNFDFILETDGHSCFKESLNKGYFYPKSGGSHGHHPDTGPSPFLLASGPDFKAGAVLEEARLVDPPVTYAKILGVSLPQAQGRVLTEILI